MNARNAFGTDTLRGFRTRTARARRSLLFSNLMTLVTVYSDLTSLQTLPIKTINEGPLIKGLKGETP
jgi:hypothetical protein